MIQTLKTADKDFKIICSRRLGNKWDGKNQWNYGEFNQKTGIYIKESNEISSHKL